MCLVSIIFWNNRSPINHNHHLYTIILCFVAFMAKTQEAASKSKVELKT